MFSTCANPDCATSFDYHRGEFFRFHNDHIEEARDTRSHSVQHFWLCECCCEKYTLHYEKRRGVLISIRSEAIRPRGTARVIAGGVTLALISPFEPFDPFERSVAVLDALVRT